MAEKQNDKGIDMRKITMAVNMLLLLCGLVYVVVVTVSGYNDRLWYKLSLMLLMMGYSLLFNIAALYGMDAFTKMTRQQGMNYFGYMIFDVVELCFLAMFVVNVRDFDEPFHYMALGVFLILTIPRHILYHSAVDGVKETDGVKSSYHTVTGIDGYKNSDNASAMTGRQVKKVKPLKDNTQTNNEAFPEPELREDRFVKMKLDEIEGYADARSVDDKGNVNIGDLKKDRN